VDGVYDADPRSNPGARRYDQLSYDEAIRKNLRVMDQTAIALCRENRLPIVVFDMKVRGNLLKVVSGETIGTRVGE
jgi:uridylate kinase